MTPAQRVTVYVTLLALAGFTAWLLSPPDIWSSVASEGSWFTDPPIYATDVP